MEDGLASAFLPRCPHGHPAATNPHPTRKKEKMKFKSLAVALVCALGVSFLAGCGGSGPKDVAKDGMKALIAGDYDSFAKISTDLPSDPQEAKAAFGVMKMAFGAMGLTMDKITFGDAVVKGDEAVVNYTVTGVPNVSGGFVKLRKVNGDWKIEDLN